MKSRQNSPKTGEADQTCSVCFLTSEPGDTLDQNMRLITCSKCHARAHRICYNPSVTGQEFLCDVCTEAPPKGKAHAQTCMVCHNPGLMKRVRDKGFAHPICLLTHPDVYVRTYRNLDFEFTETSQKKRMGEVCSICSKKTEGVLQCSEPGCPHSAHIYCSIREYNTETQKTEKEDDCQPWVFNLSPQPQNQKKNRLLRLKILENLQHHALDDNINADVTFAERDYQRYKMHHLVACPDHSKYGCYCGGRAQDDIWVICDHCLEWYHASCLRREDPNYEQTEKFTCKRCNIWAKAKAEGKLYQKQYPKLHVFDLIAIFLNHQMNPSNTHQAFLESLLFCESFPNKRSLVTQYTLQKVHSDLPILGDMRRTNEASAGDLVNKHRLIEKVAILCGINDRKRSKKKGQNAMEEFNELMDQLAASEPYKTDTIIRAYIVSGGGVDYDALVNQELTIFRDILKSKPSKEIVLNSYTAMMRGVNKLKGGAINKKWEERLPKLMQFINEPKDRSGDWINAITTILNVCKSPEDRNQLMVLSHNAHLPADLRDVVMDYVVPALQKQSRSQFPTLTLDNHSTLRMSSYQQIEHLIGSEYLSTSDQQTMFGLLLDKINTYSGLAQVRAVLGEKLSRAGYQVVRQQMDFWTSSQVQPSQLDMRTCEEYMLQCEFVVSLEDNVPARDGADFPEVLTRLRKCFMENCGVVGTRALICLNRLYEQDINLRPQIKQLGAITFGSFLHRLNFSKITGTQARRYLKIAKYLSVQADYIEQALEQFISWFKEYRAIEQLRFAEVLDRQKDVEKIQKDIVRLLDKMKVVELNTEKQEKNLMGLLVWFRLAKKAYTSFFVEGSKMTVYAIKELLKLLSQSKFPKNKLFDKVSFQVAQAERLERQIEQFNCKRRKIQPFTEVFVVSSKQTLQQARNLRQELMHSNFDFSFKIDDIEQEMKRFQKRKQQAESTFAASRNPTEPQNQQSQQAQTLQTLQNLNKYFVHECPFRYDNYKQLRKYLIEMRCNGMPKCRNELQELLACGEEHVPILLAKCQKSLDAYKQIDSLRMALEGGRVHQYTTVERLNQLKLSLLKDDAMEKSTLNHWTGKFLEAKAKYDHQRSPRYEGANLQALGKAVEVMSRCPIKNVDIESDFRKLREVFEQNIEEIRRFLIKGYKGENIQHNQILSLQDSIRILKEHRLCFQNETRIRNDLYSYLSMVERPITIPGDYIHFLQQCNQLSHSFWSEVLYQQRLKCFQSYSRYVSMQTPSDTLRICYKQACYLNSRHNRLRQHITVAISSMLKWIEAAGEAGDLGLDEEEDEGMEEEDDGDDGEDDAMGDEDEGDYSQEQDEEDISEIEDSQQPMPVLARMQQQQQPQRPNPKKKPHPAEQIIIADDSQE